MFYTFPVNRAGNQSDYVTIERGADIVLGQKMDTGKGFDVRKSFAGRMSQVRYTAFGN